MKIKDLFAAMAAHDASDLHLKPGEPPVFRVAGRLCRADGAVLDEATIEALCDPLLTKRLRDDLTLRGYADFAVQLPGMGRFRCNCFRSSGALSAAIRRVKPHVPTLEELNLPETLARITDWPDGLVLVGGPTGAGKSSTIASLLDRINHKKQVHIITIEDPIEFQFIDDQAVIHQRELGLDVPDLHEAMRSVVREDPDVLLLGELRDAASVEMALHLAETGRLVFGTVHASSAVQTINRLLDLFPATRHAQMRSNLAFNLRVITNQRLLPGIKPDTRVPAVETLFLSPVTRKFLLEGDINRMQEAMQRDSESGSEDLKRVLLRLHKSQKISKATALAAAPNPEEIRMALSGINITEGGMV